MIVRLSLRTKSVKLPVELIGALPLFAIVPERVVVVALLNCTKPAPANSSDKVAAPNGRPSRDRRSLKIVPPPTRLATPDSAETIGVIEAMLKLNVPSVLCRMSVPELWWSRRR